MIYATQFHANDLQIIGLSVDSGFESLEQVTEVMGDDRQDVTKRLIIYGNDNDRVAFSDYPFYLGECEYHEQ